MHFTGQHFDSETLLSHMDFRSLSMTQGRWTAIDPAGKAATNVANPESWNLYAYVMNNPVNLRDPSGLEGEFAVRLNEGDGNSQCTGGTSDTFCIKITVIDKKPPQDGLISVTGLEAFNRYVYLMGAVGHHGIPRAVFRALRTNYPEASRWLANKFVTGRLLGKHYYDAAHRAYNEAVRDILKLNTEEGQAEVAEDVIKAGQKVLDSDNPAIKGFLNDMKTGDGMTGREALQKALQGDGEAFGEFVTGAVGEVAEGIAVVE
jgi:RHS repeat-associated protein